MITIKKADLKFGLMYERKSTSKIIIHHSASDTDNINSIHNYHKNRKGWSGCGYHYVIHKNGDIFEGRGKNIVGAHTLGENHDSIGICVCGDLNKSEMTPHQKNSLKELLVYLLAQYERIQIYGHNNFNKTDCPGKNFDSEIIFEAINSSDKSIKITNTLDEALKIIADKKITNSPAYWKNNVNKLEYLENLIINMANYIKNV
jgi:N-acetyl-anhydromuramyl-L-alanine amidase AmpD